MLNFIRRLEPTSPGTQQESASTIKHDDILICNNMHHRALLSFNRGKKCVLKRGGFVCAFKIWSRPHVLHFLMSAFTKQFFSSSFNFFRARFLFNFAEEFVCVSVSCERNLFLFQQFAYCRYVHVPLRSFRIAEMPEPILFNFSHFSFNWLLFGCRIALLE